MLSVIEPDNVMTFQTTISDPRWLSANQTGIAEDIKGKPDREDHIWLRTRTEETTSCASSLLSLRGKWGRCCCIESKSERYSNLEFIIYIMKLVMHYLCLQYTIIAAFNSQLRLSCLKILFLINATAIQQRQYILLWFYWIWCGIISMIMLISLPYKILCGILCCINTTDIS